MDTHNNTIADSVSSLLKKNKKHFLIFLVFLMLSSVFWFLNALSKDYSTLIDLPVKYESIPHDIALDNPLPQKLQIEIHGKGFDLLKYEFSGFIFPYIIDFKNFTKKGKHYSFYTKNSIKDIQQHIPNNIQVRSIYPTEIDASFSLLTTQKVKVQPNITYHLAKQYMLKGSFNVNPKTITVSGPANILDTIHQIYTESYDLGILDHPIKKTLLLKSIPNLSFSQENVTISLDIEKFTEVKIEVPISIRNLPDTLTAKLQPQKVTIVYQTTLSDFKKIQPNQFLPIIDYTSMLNNKMATVFLRQKPRYAFNIKLHPKHILLITIPKENK